MMFVLRLKTTMCAPMTLRWYSGGSGGNCRVISTGARLELFSGDPAAECRSARAAFQTRRQVAVPLRQPGRQAGAAL